MRINKITFCYYPTIYSNLLILVLCIKIISKCTHLLYNLLKKYKVTYIFNLILYRYKFNENKIKFSLNNRYGY